MKFRALALSRPHLPAAVWSITAILSLWGIASVARADGKPAADLPSRISRLAAEVEAAEDVRAIKHLQRAYGFYLDKGMWEDVSQLFTADAVANYPAGIYVGKESIRRHLFLNVGAVKVAEVGLGDGRLYNHMNIQPVVHLDPGGRTAKGRWRALAMFGSYGGSAMWAEGVYELTYRKEGEVWKIHTLDYYSGFGAPYETGWVPPETSRTGSGGGRRPLPYPADRERKMECDGFPAACIAPFHYENPGRTAAAHAWIISEAQLSARLDINRPANLRAVLADLSRRATRLGDEQAIENLQRIYGYYFDRAAWDQIADLFAGDATMEIGLQGVYVGKQHLRRFLETLSPQGLSGGVLNDHLQLQILVDIAPDGRTACRLGNHLQLQPVIDVAADGRTAKIRSRMLQQMSLGGRASLGGAVYENEALKEDGIWRFKTDHAYNTFSAGYTGGWAKNASRAMPGPNKDLPPDGPPTASIAMFPVVYDIPFHYANPVTGRTEVPPVRPAEDPEVVAAMAASDRALSKGIPSGGQRGMPPAIAAALREIGPKIDGPRTAALYAPLQASEPYAGVNVVRDVHYGPHERHVADVFTSSVTAQGAAGRPIVVFVHGGGFTRGAKHSPGSPFYDNIGVWAVRHGLVGVTINYRLAPKFQWPAGIEDLTLLIPWVRAHAGEYGGDPAKVFLWGHSAGAAHVADYLAHAANTGADPGVAGAILTSGFYDLGDKVSIWRDYYGDDVTQYAARSSLPGLLKTATPLLVTYAELDPDSFQVETRGLIDARSREGRPVHSVRLAGHSHISETYAVGTGDESLSGPVLDFIQGAGGAAKGGSR